MDFTPLSLTPVHVPVLIDPDPVHHLTLTDPAELVLTDLSHGPQVTVHAYDSPEATIQLMIRAGVRLAFVTTHEEWMIGMVSAADLQGERAVQMAQLRGVSASELYIQDLMEPVDVWQALDYEVMHRSLIGHVVASLQHYGRRHLIVTEQRDGCSILRGILSASRIERACGIAIATSARAHRFADSEAEPATT
jgi:hypothetical protein